MPKARLKRLISKLCQVSAEQTCLKLIKYGLFLISIQTETGWFIHLFYIYCDDPRMQYLQSIDPLTDNVELLWTFAVWFSPWLLTH